VSRKATTKEDGVRQLDDGSFTVGGARLAVGYDVFLLPDNFDQLPAATADDREAVPDYAAKSRHVKVMHPLFLLLVTLVIMTV
jgi:hypothetical protein